MKTCILCEWEPVSWFQNHKIHEHHAWGYYPGAKTIPVCVSCHRKIHHRIKSGHDMTPGSADYQKLYDELKPTRDKYRHQRELNRQLGRL